MDEDTFERFVRDVLGQQTQAYHKSWSTLHQYIPKPKEEPRPKGQEIIDRNGVVFSRYDDYSDPSCFYIIIKIKESNTIIRMQGSLIWTLGLQEILSNTTPEQRMFKILARELTKLAPEIRAYEKKWERRKVSEERKWSQPKLVTQYPPEPDYESPSYDV